MATLSSLSSPSTSPLSGGSEQGGSQDVDGSGTGSGAREFCLRWNNHQVNLLSFCAAQLSKESLVDVTLVTAEGRQIQAHKLVLSASSPYFQNVFERNPCKHPVVILKDVVYCDLTAIINFIYNGQVNISQDRINSILSTASALQVKGLAQVPPEELKRVGSVHSVDEPPELPRKRPKKSLASMSSNQSAPSTSGYTTRSLDIDSDNCREAGSPVPVFVQGSTPSPLIKSRSLDHHSSAQAHSSSVTTMCMDDSGQSRCLRVDGESGESGLLPERGGVFRGRRGRPLLRQHRIKRDNESSPMLFIDEDQYPCPPASSPMRSKSFDGSECLSMSTSLSTLSALSSRQNHIKEDMSSRNGCASSVLTTSGSKASSTSSGVPTVPILRVSQSSPTPPSSPPASPPMLRIHESGPSNKCNNSSTTSSGSGLGFGSTSTSTSSSAPPLSRGTSLPASTVTHRQTSVVLSPVTLASSSSSSSSSLLTVPGSSCGPLILSASHLVKQHSQPLLPSSMEHSHPLAYPIRRQHSTPATSTMSRTHVVPVASRRPLSGVPGAPPTVFQILSSSEGASSKRKEALHTRHSSGSSTSSAPAFLLDHATTLVQILPASASETHLTSFDKESGGSGSGGGEGRKREGVLLRRDASGGADSTESVQISSFSSEDSITDGSDGGGEGQVTLLQRSGHCPVLRPGPALGCNFCWNSVDSCGRILRRKTKYHCPECRINLCIVPCFQNYHEKAGVGDAAAVTDATGAPATSSGANTPAPVITTTYPPPGLPGAPFKKARPTAGTRKRLE